MTFTLLLLGFIAGVVCLFYQAKSEDKRLADMARKVREKNG